MIKEKEISVLLIDDDATDRELFREAVAESKMLCVVEELSNGLDVIAHLESAKTIPDMILLDLNMPLKDGRETLRELKNHRELQFIPVIILSTSNAYFDVAQSYQYGASLFLSKPHDFGELTDMVTTLLQLASRYTSFVKDKKTGARGS